MTDRLCRSCEHFSTERSWKGMGKCALMTDSNTLESVGEPYDPTRVYPWDYEGYSSGAHVGPQFGCIHWKQKQ